MGLFSCFGGRRSNRVAPDGGSSSTEKGASQQSQPGSEPRTLATQKALHDVINELSRADGSRMQRALVLKCAGCLDSLLNDILAAANLVASSAQTSITVQHQLPADLRALHKQLTQACSNARTAAAVDVVAAIQQLSNCLYEYFQQKQDNWPVNEDVAECNVPAADALVNILNIILFSQVTLDTVAVLHGRYEQVSDLLGSIGLTVRNLAACMQPANKATLAYLLLGGESAVGEIKVPLVVVRRTAFWDALHQLQQQGIVPTEQQQVEGLQLAKLFPRFVDESLAVQQQQAAEPYQQSPGQSRHSSAAAEQRNAASGICQQASGVLAVEGGEGHGPRKEFFRLAGENWTRPSDQQPALLVHLRAAGTWWFNTTLPQKLHLQAAYWALGWLLGQAIVNRVTVGVQLAPLLLHRMLQPEDQEFKPGLSVLQQHDPDAAQGLKAVLSMPQQQYQQLLQVEDQPSSLTRQAYIDAAVEQLLVLDVQWQLEALRRGFHRVLDLQVLWDCCLNGQSLAAAICGPAADAADADFNIRQIFRVRLEDDGSVPSGTAAAAGDGPSQHVVASSSRGRAVAASTMQLTAQSLWQVLDSWDPQRKRAFVKFVTGSDGLPPPGSEQLILSFPFVAYGINQHQQMLGTLPQSHTCANTLELPDYAEALVATDPQLAQQWRDHESLGAAVGLHQILERCQQVLEDRLQVAISSCQGYALDESSALADVPASTTLRPAAVQHVQIEQTTVETNPDDVLNLSAENSSTATELPGDSLDHPAAGPGGSAVTPAADSFTAVLVVEPPANLSSGSVIMAEAASANVFGLNALKTTGSFGQQQQPGQQPGRAAQQGSQDQQHKKPAKPVKLQEPVVKTGPQPSSAPKLLTESDEEFLDEIINAELLVRKAEAQKEDCAISACSQQAQHLS